VTLVAASWADYYQNPMARHYNPAWLVVTATPQRRGYGFRKRSGSLAMLAAMRRASSLLRRFMDICRTINVSKRLSISVADDQ
jgi:hypothetical protein